MVLDETLQQFRESILFFQSDSMVRLDSSFFEFYNIFLANLNETILHPYTTLSKEFNKSCAEFPLYNLEAYAARRVVIMCDEVNRFIQRVIPYTERIIREYYPEPETLTSETLMELIVQEYFDTMNKYLEYVVPVYNQNPTCVIPLLKKFFAIYKKPIKVLLKINKDMIKLVRKGERRDFKYISGGVSKLFGVSNKLTNCSDESVIDTFGCVSDFVGYDCEKRKSGCGPVYKSIFITLNHFKKIEAYKNYYDLSFDIFYTITEKVEESLLRWSVQVDKCIIR